MRDHEGREGLNTHSNVEVLDEGFVDWLEWCWKVFGAFWLICLDMREVLGLWSMKRSCGIYFPCAGLIALCIRIVVGGAHPIVALFKSAII